MDASFQSRVEQLATEFASEATTVEELNGLMRLMMKSGLERMLDTEMDVHLGRRSTPALVQLEAAQAEPLAPAAGEKQGPPNRRNGRSRKTVQDDVGEVTRVARPFWVAPTIFAQKTVPYDSILSQNRRCCLQQEDRTSSKHPTQRHPDGLPLLIVSSRTSRIGHEARRRRFVAWPWDHYALGHRATQSSSCCAGTDDFPNESTPRAKPTAENHRWYPVDRKTDALDQRGDLGRQLAYRLGIVNQKSPVETT